MRSTRGFGAMACVAALAAVSPAWAQAPPAVVASRPGPAAAEGGGEHSAPSSVFDAAITKRELGFIPRFGVGDGFSLKLSGSARLRAEHRRWTLEDTLPVLPGHDHGTHTVHTTSGAAQSAHGPSDIENRDTSHFESRLRFGGELTFSDSWSATLQLQHQRRWSDDRDALDNEDQLDLYQGFVEFAPGADWAIRAGRFSVPSFGDGRIMSDNAWDGLGRALDGVSAIWHPEGAGLTLLLTNTGIDDPVRSSYDNDDDFWFGGLALELRQLKWLDVDFYAFGRYFDQAFAAEDPLDTERGRKLDVTLGTQWALKLGGVRLVGEIYGQFGQHGPDTVRAWASAERIEYTPWEGDFHGIPAPTLFFEHAFASGDQRHTDGVRNTFDPLFTNYHDHLGPFDKLGYRNVSALAVGWSQSMSLFWHRLAPVTFTFVARGSFLDSQNDAWYGADGTPILRDPTGDVASSTTLEGELSGWFTSTWLGGDLELSAGLAHWCPNNFAGDLNFHEHAYRFWVSTQVKF